MSEQGSIVIDRLDLFNARDLTASQVAESFVEPTIFAKLCEGSNTLLMGPRGSGKTTLLKMLTAEGVERRRLGSDSSEAPEFSGVYIPIDVQLADRLDSVSSAGLGDAISEIVASSLYAFHVFRCITDALAWHCVSARRHSADHRLARSDEATAIEALAENSNRSPNGERSSSWPPGSPLPRTRIVESTGVSCSHGSGGRRRRT